MHQLVKILTDEDGHKEEGRGWCLVEQYGDSPRTVCCGEVFGMGEGTVTYKTKFKSKGGITCDRCLKRIRWFKSIKL